MKQLFVFLSVLTFILSSCTSKIPEEAFPVSEVHEETWDDVFLHSSDLEVFTWSTGQIHGDPYGLLNKKHENAPVFNEKRIFVDVPVTCVYSQHNGWMLFDTGIDKSVQDNPYKKFNGILIKMIIGELRQEPGQDAATRLAGMGVTPDYVFLTHMHFDHVMGITDLPSNCTYIKGADEKPFEIPLLFTLTHYRHVQSFENISFSRGKPLYPFDEVVDVFGDSSVFAINTKGHTKGHTSYLINSSDGPVLVAGDEVNIPQNLDSGSGPGSYSWNIELAEKHFNQIREFLKMYPSVKLQMGHYIEE